MENQIPKIIHYCWFGGNELSTLAQKCIESWKKYFPEHKIIEWNETNFDINCCQYVKNAYAEKKWAHVSDYVRFYVLYKYGGIYFDTDVQVINSFSDILENGAFMGCEKWEGAINTGLGFGVPQKNPFIKSILEEYENSSFYNSKGQADIYYTVVVRVTNKMKELGFTPSCKPQKICNITIYPKDYFNPMVYETGELKITKNTKSIHWYDASWFPKGDKKIHLVEQKLRSKIKFPFCEIFCFIYRKGYRLMEFLHIIKK